MTTVWTAWPENANAGSPAYAAADFRRVEAVWHTPHPSGSARPLGATSGRTPNSWLVTLSGSTINIAPGAGVLDVETTATTGAYRVGSDSIDTSLTATAAAGSTRIDGVYVQLDDTDVDGSTFRKAIPVYVAGTAGSGTPPTGGAIPARSLRIATITVPSSGLGSATIAMEPLFTVALGGTLPVSASAAYPASPYPGQRVYDIALAYDLEWNGTLWKPCANLAMEFPRTSANASDNYTSGSNVSLMNGTWTGAPAGVYELSFDLLYAGTSVQSGTGIFSVGGTSITKDANGNEMRVDIGVAGTPINAHRTRLYTHGGGNMVLLFTHNIGGGTGTIETAGSGLLARFLY